MRRPPVAKLASGVATVLVVLAVAAPGHLPVIGWVWRPIAAADTCPAADPLLLTVSGATRSTSSVVTPAETTPAPRRGSNQGESPISSESAPVNGPVRVTSPSAPAEPAGSGSPSGGESTSTTATTTTTAPATTSGAATSTAPPGTTAAPVTTSPGQQWNFGGTLDGAGEGEFSLTMPAPGTVTITLVTDAVGAPRRWTVRLARGEATIGHAAGNAGSLIVLTAAVTPVRYTIEIDGQGSYTLGVLFVA